MALTAPKEVKNIRPDTTVDWNPQVLEDWMAEQGDVGIQWVSESIGKNRFYLYKCKEKKRIGRDALIKLQDLTGIPKSYYMGNMTLTEAKEEQVKELEEQFHKENPKIYTAPAAEFNIPDQEPPKVDESECNCVAQKLVCRRAGCS